MALGRVHDQRTFNAFRHARARGRSGPVGVTVLLDETNQGRDHASGPRLAFAIGRWTGSAVVRNRVRRRLRSVVAALELPAGAYLVTASGEAAQLPFDDLRRHVETAAATALGRGANP
jgi:ribonuclease P protein component